jgi:hypothetical protein
MTTVLRSQWGPQWSVSPQCHHNDHSITTVPPQSMTTVLQQCHHSDQHHHSAIEVTSVSPLRHHRTTIATMIKVLLQWHGDHKSATVAPNNDHSIHTTPTTFRAQYCHSTAMVQTHGAYTIVSVQCHHISATVLSQHRSGTIVAPQCRHNDHSITTVTTVAPR